MEPQNATAHVEADRCTIWAPTQSAALAQDVARRITDLPRDRIEVHTTYLGGGFGRRLAQDYVGEAVHVSARLRRPVKVVFSREDDLARDDYRPLTLHLLRGVVDGRGVVAWLHRIVGQSIAARVAPDWAQSIVPAAVPGAVKVAAARTAGALLSANVVPDPASIQGAAELRYAIPNQRIEYAAVENAVPVGFWRSVGHSQNAFVAESFLDELAAVRGADPVALRRALLADDPLGRTVLERAAARAAWGTPLPPGRARGVAQWTSFGTACAMVAEVSVDGPAIRVHRVVAAVDCGLAVNPDLVAAQIESGIVFGLGAALHQEVRIERGRVAPSNFHDYPLLRMHECPVIEVEIVPSDRPPTGVGEPGVPPIAPAVANAVFALTGRRLRRLPLGRALAEIGGGS